MLTDCPPPKWTENSENKSVKVEVNLKIKSIATEKVKNKKIASVGTSANQKRSISVWRCVQAIEKSAKEKIKTQRVLAKS